MEAMPGSAFEVIEAKFFIELLGGLFADPRARPPSRLVHQPRKERPQPPLQIPIPIRHRRLRKSLSQRSTKILADLLAFFVATMSWALESNWD
jgi:hypothetical protein